MIKVFSSIRSTYRAVSVAIDGGHISNDIQRSLELVRTCHQDLQVLINLRTEHLHLLENQPQSLERLNAVIERVHRGMLDAYQIVEKYRLQIHSGKTSLQNQITWANRDSQEFQALGPIINQHHAAVLAEIGFLRTITLITSQNDPGKPTQSIALDDKNIFDNKELLEDFMGDILVGRDTSPPPTSKVSNRASMPKLLSKQDYCDLPEPVIPNLIPHQQPLISSQIFEHTSSPWAAGVQTNEGGSQRNHRVVLNQSDHSGLSLLFRDELDQSFDSLASLQSRPLQTHSSDSLHRSSMPPSCLPSIDGDTLVPSPPAHHSLSSRLCTLSTSSRETVGRQRSETSPEMTMGRPHLLSLPPTPPTNKPPLISISTSSPTSDTLQNVYPRQRLIPFAERYTNMGNTPRAENQQYSPWRPIQYDHAHELQGSEISHGSSTSQQSSASISDT